VCPWCQVHSRVLQIVYRCLCAVLCMSHFGIQACMLFGEGSTSQVVVTQPSIAAWNQGHSPGEETGLVSTATWWKYVAT
jgi:hypothetical protein